MVTFYDVPADAFIEALAERLEDHLEPPEWMRYAKTSPAKEFPPERDDFWYVRGASVLRKVAMAGPVGVSRLATEYGGRAEGTHRFGTRPGRRVDGSRKIIRTILQQLEDADLVLLEEGAGRRIAPAGRELLDGVAAEVHADLDREELERYA
ncbi:MAG: 30S ribosomal protein S19e [Halobacteriota archaeon]